MGNPVSQESLDTAKRLRMVAEQAIISGNTVKISEFQKFAPLFDNSIRQVSYDKQAEALRLMEEYKQRFSLYHPIVITDESGNTLQVLPPMFVQCPLINQSVPKSGEMMQTFANITMSSSQPEAKKLQISAVVRDAGVHATQTDPKFAQRQAVAASLAEKFDKLNEMSAIPAVQIAASDKTKNMEWK